MADILPLHDSVYLKNATKEELKFANRYIQCALKKEFTIKIKVEPEVIERVTSREFIGI